jgi:hypothetical protein
MVAFRKQGCADRSTVLAENLMKTALYLYDNTQQPPLKPQIKNPPQPKKE